MTSHSQFIATFENHLEPLISLKDLIILLTQYTNKKPAQVANKLERLLFDFRKGGSRNQYDNSFCYCTIFEMRDNGKIYTYEPMTNHFKDAFDHIKGYLNEVIALNSVNVLDLSRFSVKRSEIAQRIKKAEISLLDKASANQTEEISQLEGDYISLYDLLEWAKPEYSNLSDTAKDLMRLLNGANIQLYRHYTGIKKSIDKDEQKILDMLIFVEQNNGYEKAEPFNFDEDIPF
ncbi:hypothetical protein ACWIVY_02510 [Ursidibacter sp. B-7004-1]